MLWAPFFIVGCPRSGTTLLNVLIDAHPDIAIPPESFVFARCGMLFDACGDLDDPARLRSLVGELQEDERIRAWKLDTDVDSFCAGLDARSVRGVVTHLFGLYAAQQGKLLWGDKTPHHALCVDRIMRVFPDARIIHLVRDGRDVAESTARIAIGPSSVLAIARRWKLYMDTVRDAAARLPSDQFLEVRFEDLVRDPAGTRRRIMAFIGEDDSSCPPVDQALPDTGTRERSAGYAHHASLRSAITAAKIGVFKSAFTPRQIELFEAVAGEALTRHGYALTTEHPRPPTAGEEFSAFMLDHTVRYFRKFQQPGALRQIAKELRLTLQQRWRRIARRNKSNGRPIAKGA